ncbi:MAG: glycoside hydrolase family 9 protein [Bacillota bacterium]
MKKIVVLLLVVSMLGACLVPANLAFAADYNYSEALTKSIVFFDANRCGKDVATGNYFSWRGACHTSDGSTVGKDLTGGFHDAGDHVKFGLPQAYAAATLGWTLYEFKDVLDATGNTQKMLSTLKLFTDYLLKCHPDPNTFYHQVGDGGADHGYWGSPENQTGTRPVKTANPGSEVTGLTSAALSIMYLNYKNIDAAYANKCLAAAKTLYAKAKTNPGFYDEQSFYASGSIYDDMAWAAVWLYIIEKNETYLAEAEVNVTKRNKYNDDPFQHKWTMCWDDMYLPVHYKLMEITGKQIYKDALNFSFNYWMNSLAKTPGGLRYLHNWGVLRYASAEAMLALLYYKHTNDEKLKTFAKSQIDYALGSNPLNMSYIIGMGTKWPKHPHHRAAHPVMGAPEAKYELTGSLIGGPNATDQFIDDINQYQYTEVAIDYNASFVGAAAGMVKYFGNVVIPSPSPSPTFKLGDLNDDGAIDSTDVTLLKRRVLGIPATINEKAADLNKDGLVNSTDYTILKRVVLRIIPAPV